MCYCQIVTARVDILESSYEKFYGGFTATTTMSTSVQIIITVETRHVKNDRKKFGEFTPFLLFSNESV
jgi:hypothetical protein